MKKRDWFIVLAIICGPFVSTLWSYRYWDALRWHMAWIADWAEPTDGTGTLAGMVAIAAHVAAFGYLATRKGWLP